MLPTCSLRYLRFLAQKNARFLWLLFLPFKRGLKNDGFELLASAIFIGVQGSLGWWHNMVAGRNSAVFVENNKLRLVTCRSDRDDYLALSAWAWVLFQWRSWRRTRWFFEHWKSPDGFYLVCLWKVKIMPSEVECVYCKELPFFSKMAEGLLLYTCYFLNITF